MSNKLLVQCSAGRDEAERATLPFVIANVAVTAEQETVMFLTLEAVRLATRGTADGVQTHGLPPLAEVMQAFVANGGQIWACAACTKPRGISDADLIEGARIVTAANVVEFLAAGAKTL